MTDFVKFVIGMMRNILTMMDGWQIDFYGFRISWLSILVVFILIAMFAGYLYKGAKG